MNELPQPWVFPFITTTFGRYVMWSTGFTTWSVRWTLVIPLITSRVVSTHHTHNPIMKHILNIYSNVKATTNSACRRSAYKSATLKTKNMSKIQDLHSSWPPPNTVMWQTIHAVQKFYVVQQYQSTMWMKASTGRLRCNQRLTLAGQWHTPNASTWPFAYEQYFATYGT